MMDWLVGGIRYWSGEIAGLPLYILTCKTEAQRMADARIRADKIVTREMQIAKTKPGSEHKPPIMNPITSKNVLNESLSPDITIQSFLSRLSL